MDALALQDEVETFIAEVIKQSAEQHLDEYRQKQQEDPTCSQVKQFFQTEWPAEKNHLRVDLIPYWKMKDLLSVCNDLVLYNERIVIPERLRKDVMERIHEGHQGIDRCRARLRSSVWWPNANQHISEMVQNCAECAKTAKKRREPLVSTPLPNYPWQVIGTDLFELDKKQYIVVVDYFSRFPEVLELKSTSSAMH